MIYVAPTAVVVGDVAIGRGSSVWYGAVVRADMDRIVIGEDCSIQDNAVVHGDAGIPTLLGSRITVGHGAVVHGCAVGDDCLIGMNATTTSRAQLAGGAPPGGPSGAPAPRSVPPLEELRGAPSLRVHITGSHETR